MCLWIYFLWIRQGIYLLPISCKIGRVDLMKFIVNQDHYCFFIFFSFWKCIHFLIHLYIYISLTFYLTIYLYISSFSSFFSYYSCLSLQERYFRSRLQSNLIQNPQPFSCYSTAYQFSSQILSFSLSLSLFLSLSLSLSLSHELYSQLNSERFGKQ